MTSLNKHKQQLPKILLLLLLPMTTIGFSQSDNLIDSLYQVVQETDETDEKIVKYMDFMYEINDRYHPDLEIYADEFLTYAQKNSSIEGIAHAYRYKAFAQNNEFNFEEAIKYHKISLDNFSQIGEDKYAIEMQKSIVICNQELGAVVQYEKELEKYRQLVEKFDDNYCWGNYYIMKAEESSKKNELIKVEEYSNKAIEMFDSYEGEHAFEKAIILANMANTLLNDAPAKSIKYLEEARAIAEKRTDVVDFLAYIIGLQSGAYQIAGNYEKAIDFAFEEVALFDSLHFLSDMAEAKINLGMLHFELNEIEKARNLYQEAILLSKEAAFHRGKISANYRLGELYLSQTDYEKAIFCYKQANSLADSIQENKLKLDNQSSLATAYIQSGQAEKGYKILLKTLEENNQESKTTDRNIYLGLADFFIVKEDWKKVLEYGEKSYQLSKETENNDIIPQIAGILYQANKELKRYPTALEWLEIQKEAETEVLNKSNIRKLTAARLNADFDKEKEVLALEQAQQEAILKAETKQSQTAAAGIGLLALLGFGFFWNARRQNKKITVQNTQISNQNSQLEQLNTTKDRIFAIIGHDLRKPVIAFNGISETINYLIQKEDYSTLKKLGTEIEQDGFSMQKLTDNLLNWALMQRDVMPHKPEVVALSPKVEEVFAIFEKVANGKDIELNHAIPADLEVYADGNALLTILVNLTDNALKYTPQGGQVTIEGITTQEGIKINIMDNGVGMAAEQLHDIFLLQKDKSKKGTKGEKGTGLGLHLVNELVKMNNGNIEAKSEIGKGTTFEVRLPKGKMAA